jgi:hypothetical protein
MSQINKMRILAVVSLAGMALGGCANNIAYDTHGYLDRRDSIELTAGDANASNIALQMVDPWPRYAGNKTIAYNGQRMQAAVERYRNNQVFTPRGVSSSSVYAPSSNGNAGSGSGNNTPVGPTVTGTK